MEPCPLGIVALVMGKNARDEAARTGAQVDGKMQAAYIIGFITTVLLVIGVVGFALMMVAGAASA